MRVFVLEDDPMRIAWFVERFKQDDLTLCTTAAGACLVFPESHWDLACLDHDLGGETFVDSARNDTGAEFVRACQAELANCPAVAVHSMNQAGAMRMVALIPQAKWIPFPVLKANLDAIQEASQDNITQKA